jgi:hypothetical protein
MKDRRAAHSMQAFSGAEETNGRTMKVASNVKFHETFPIIAHGPIEAARECVIFIKPCAKKSAIGSALSHGQRQ